MRRTQVTRLAARRVRRLLRSPLAFCLLAVGLTAATGAVMNGLSASARAQAATFGHLRAVPVARRALAIGNEVGPGDVTMRRLPAALIPHGPVASRLVGRVVLVPVAPGEVVLQAKLAPWGRRGVAALLPDGTRALAIPLGAGTPPISVGNHVDLLAAFSPDQAQGAGASTDSGGAVAGDPNGAGPSGAESASSADPSFPVAEDALVVAVGHETITVAVDQDVAPAVAYAIAAGTVVIALTG